MKVLGLLASLKVQTAQSYFRFYTVTGGVNGTDVAE